MHILFSVPSKILELTIYGNDTAIAGSMYEITCKIKKTIDGLLFSPNATWITGKGERDNIITNSPDSSTSILKFSPLKTSHAGNYTCSGTIFSLVRPEEPYSIVNTYHLTVQSKSM